MEKTIYDKYWKQYIKDYLECSFEDVELNEEDISTIVKRLNEYDGFWSDIDSYLYDFICDRMEEKKQ